MTEELAYRIEVRGARGLMPMDPNGQSDPYAKVGVADNISGEFIDPNTILRSKTHYVTLTPVWKGFFIVAKLTEYKIRIEVWDKDQANDDFEGMTILDLRTLEGNEQEMWIPLVGRTPKEQVTGDVNIFVVKGPFSEIQSLTRSRSNSNIVPPPTAVKEDEKVIKKLHQDLKTKSGRLELMKENNTVLDQQLVKMKQQVEQLQAELQKKNLQLESQEGELTKVKTQAVELQQALQEKQNVSQMVKDWNDKGKEIKKLQADLRAKFQLRRTGNTEEEGINQEGKLKRSSSLEVKEEEGQLLSMDSIVEQWTEYSNMIDSLEVDLRLKKDELEKKEKQLSDANQQITKLEEITLKFEEKEAELKVAKQKVEQLEEDKDKQLDERISELQQNLESLEHQMKEAEDRIEESENRCKESEKKREESEKQRLEDAKRIEEAEQKCAESEKRREEEEKRREEVEIQFREAKKAREEAEKKRDEEAHLREEERVMRKDAELSREEAEKKKEEAEETLKEAAASFNKMQAELNAKLQEIESSAQKLKSSAELTTEEQESIQLRLAEKEKLLESKEEQLRIEIQAREELELTLRKTKDEQILSTETQTLQLEVKAKEEELVKLREIRAELENQHTRDEEIILRLNKEEQTTGNSQNDSKKLEGEKDKLVQALQAELLEKSHQLQQAINSEQKARSELLSLESKNGQLIADKTSLQTKVEQLQSQHSYALTTSPVTLNSSSNALGNGPSPQLVFFRPKSEVQRSDSMEQVLVMKKTTPQREESEEVFKSGNAQFARRAERQQDEALSPNPTTLTFIRPKSPDTSRDEIQRRDKERVEKNLAQLEGLELTASGVQVIDVSKLPELPRTHEVTPTVSDNNNNNNNNNSQVSKRNRGFCFAIFGKKDK